MEKIGSKPIDELVRMAVQGHGPSFTALWDTYIDQLRSFIKGIFKNVDSFYVDDICSRSFEKAFRQIQTYDSSKSQFLTWLKSIAKNTALDEVNKEKRVHPSGRTVYLDDVESSSSVASIPDAVDNPLDTIIKEETNLASAGFIDKLPELYREVARKRLIEGLQYKEISLELGLELNTVRTRIRRAKEMMDKMNSEADK